MNADDRLDRALRILFETFGHAPTPAQIEGYRMALEDIPVRDIEAAAAKALRESEHLPKPAKLREFAGRGKDTRPYHLPYQPTPKALAERVRESWEPVRQLAATSEPEPLGGILAVLIDKRERS